MYIINIPLICALQHFPPYSDSSLAAGLLLPCICSLRQREAGSGGTEAWVALIHGLQQLRRWLFVKTPSWESQKLNWASCSLQVLPERQKALTKECGIRVSLFKLTSTACHALTKMSILPQEQDFSGFTPKHVIQYLPFLPRLRYVAKGCEISPASLKSSHSLCIHDHRERGNMDKIHAALKKKKKISSKAAAL